jgi:hypothetical protein
MAKKLHCSLCGKSDDEIRKLATGPGGVHICDELILELGPVVNSGQGCG